jgi:formate hydrogenlyase subunit 3/multisubunit Na+/H+ antiporter MnhD subunit
MALALWSILALLGVSILAVILASRAAAGSKAATPIVYGLCLGISALLLATGVNQLAHSAATASEITLPVGLPWLGAHFRLDALASFFMIVVNLGAMAASLYALGYGAHEEMRGRILPFFPVFLAGMNLVILAADAFSFLFSWEFMSLSSWALVIAHHHEAENRHAGFVYLVMASFGTMMLLLAFGLLAGSAGNYSFAAMRAASTTPWLTGLVLVLALIGAGSKAGLIPLHIWLPLAHPAAPSHVSALMSGVMTKVAVYGFIRIAFDLLGPPAVWWSMLVLALGGITAVFGMLHALIARDLKKILAFSTIENIGVIYAALGLALAFEANHMGWAAALAFTAALFHVLNHSFYKSLLFFGAGAVLHATGERDIEKLGGLIRTMPYTAFVFLGGALAISALPPLNGFVSEWLVFQAILLSPMLQQWGLTLIIPAIGVLLALSAALCAGVFVRVFGISFLGRPRSLMAQNARETDRWSLAAMFILLAFCLLAGVLPGFVIDAIAPVTQALTGATMPQQASIPWLSIAPIAASRSSYNGLLVFVFISFSALAAAQMIHRFGSRALRRVPAWDCGYPDPSPLTQYTASSFAQPLRRVLGHIAFTIRLHLALPQPGETRPAHFNVEIRDRIWEGLYRPVLKAINFGADTFNKLQTLTIRGYLSLVFVALVGLLFMVALWR